MLLDGVGIVRHSATSWHTHAQAQQTLQAKLDMLQSNLEAERAEVQALSQQMVDVQSIRDAHAALAHQLQESTARADALQHDMQQATKQLQESQAAQKALDEELQMSNTRLHEQQQAMQQQEQLLQLQAQQQQHVEVKAGDDKVDDKGGQGGIDAAYVQRLEQELKVCSHIVFVL